MGGAAGKEPPCEKEPRRGAPYLQIHGEKVPFVNPGSTTVGDTQEDMRAFSHK